MSRPPTLQRKYTSQVMTARHQEIIRLIVLGLENKAIAAMLGVTPQTVSNVRNSPLAQHYMDTLKIARDATTVDIGRTLVQVAEKGAKYLDELIDGVHDDQGVTPGLKAKVSWDALSRVGHSPVVRTHTINEDRITPEMLELMKERSAKAKADMRVDLGEDAAEATFTMDYPTDLDA